MVPRAPPTVTPPSVFRPDWKTLHHFNVCPTPTSLHRFCGANDKPKHAWFWDQKQKTITVIEAQIFKPELPVLRPKLRNPSLSWFWDSTKKPTTGFEVKPGETVATSFEAKLEKTVATGFVAKPAKIVWVVLRPNHSQTVDLGFEAQPRNQRS
jgi:hypothetical protein